MTRTPRLRVSRRGLRLRLSVRVLTSELDFNFKLNSGESESLAVTVVTAPFGLANSDSGCRGGIRLVGAESSVISAYTRNLKQRTSGARVTALVS